MSRKAWYVVGAILFVSVLVGLLFFGRGEQNDQQQQLATEVNEPVGFNKSLHPISEPGSLWWIVNKDRPLTKNYVPSELVAPRIPLRWDKTAESMQVDIRVAQPLEEMVADAKKAGHNLMLISAYRSEEYQKQLYDGYVKAYGREEAEKFSAQPGTSEHQTGLAVDLGRIDGKCEIETCFGDLPEGKWLAENAHKYGFIVRYLKGKEAVTGYEYEPWHFRYVGVELATELYRTGLTMEEFFGLT